MLEKIENRLNKGGRKQRGKKQLKSRVNITFPIDTIGLYAKRDIEMRLEQFKQIRSDLVRLVSGQFKIIFTVLPNKPVTKKGILVRMGKGKGKIDHFSSFIKRGTICIILVSNSILTKERKEEVKEEIIRKLEEKVLKKYSFLSLKLFI